MESDQALKIDDEFIKRNCLSLVLRSDFNRLKNIIVNYIEKGGKEIIIDGITFYYPFELVLSVHKGRESSGDSKLIINFYNSKLWYGIKINIKNKDLNINFNDTEIYKNIEILIENGNITLENTSLLQDNIKFLIKNGNITFKNVTLFLDIERNKYYFNTLKLENLNNNIVFSSENHDVIIENARLLSSGEKSKGEVKFSGKLVISNSELRNLSFIFVDNYKSILLLNKDFVNGVINIDNINNNIVIFRSINIIDEENSKINLYIMNFNTYKFKKNILEEVCFLDISSSTYDYINIVVKNDKNVVVKKFYELLVEYDVNNINFNNILNISWKYCKHYITNIDISMLYYESFLSIKSLEQYIEKNGYYDSADLIYVTRMKVQRKIYNNNYKNTLYAIISGIYDCLSNYGENINKIISQYVFTIIVSTFFVAAMLLYFQKNIFGNNVVAGFVIAFIITVSSILQNPLNILQYYNLNSRGLVEIMLILSFLLRAVFIILTGVLFITLRRKFERKRTA